MKKGAPAVRAPFGSVMVPLKLFFVGYPGERIFSGSGVPKAGYEPARVSHHPGVKIIAGHPMER
jgi:hypothetical protein